jgi:xanthine/CO dehydrogenase XdhC/CoxF family maturation factor
VGLDLGGREPEEIALSILAELQAERHARRQLVWREGGSRDAAA